MQNEDRIRARARELWEREGRPEGRHEEYWAQAYREIQAEHGHASEPLPEPWPSVTAPEEDGPTASAAVAAEEAVGVPGRI
jgi:hypothetical protein